jgi:shikimate kinase
MNLILFGFKASGKTYFARKLSELTKEPFLDLDELLLRKAQEQFHHSYSLQELYRFLGEKEFRDLEEKTVGSLTSHPILAVGGGTVLNPSSLSHLKSLGQLVYLKASFETVWGRIQKGPVPAFLDPSDPQNSLFVLYQKRLPLYEAIPAICFDVDKESEENILQSMQEILYK